MALAETEARICTLEALIQSTKDYVSALSIQIAVTRDLLVQSEAVKNNKDSSFKKALGIGSDFISYRRSEASGYEKEVSKANKLIPGYEEELQRHLQEYVSSNDSEYQALERIAEEIMLMRRETNKIISLADSALNYGSTEKDNYRMTELKSAKIKYDDYHSRFNQFIRKLGSAYEEISEIGRDLSLNYRFENSYSNEIEVRDYRDALIELKDTLERQTNACQDRMAGRIQNAREQFAAKRQQ